MNGTKSVSEEKTNIIELDENECITIVRKATKSENVKIKNFSSQNFGESLGFLGEYYNLKIVACVDGSENQEFNYFLKSLPVVDLKCKRDMLIETGIFRKEIDIYDRILEKFVDIDIGNDFWCPSVYLLREDLIVFNDLSLLGYKTLSFDCFDFSQQHVEATLKSLANLHGCSIAYEHQENICIGTEFSDILFEVSIMEVPWFKAGLDIVKQIAESEFDIKNSEIFYKKIFNVIDIMESSPFDIPKVLCHRDLWKNNLMFRDNPTHCILIDFQTSRYLSLSVDVTMAIIATTRREHYEKMMDHYLHYYYQQLEKKLFKFEIDLKSIMEYDNFVKSCNFHKKVHLVYKTVIISLTQVPQELFKNFTENDYKELASGDRWRLIKKFMNEDAGYRMRLVDAVEAIVNEFYSVY